MRTEMRTETEMRAEMEMRAETEMRAGMGARVRAGSRRMLGESKGGKAELSALVCSRSFPALSRYFARFPALTRAHMPVPAVAQGRDKAQEALSALQRVHAEVHRTHAAAVALLPALLPALIPLLYPDPCFLLSIGGQTVARLAAQQALAGSHEQQVRALLDQLERLQAADGTSANTGADAVAALRAADADKAVRIVALERQAYVLNAMPSTSERWC